MNICVCTPARHARSETFIEAHISRLPGRVTPIVGAFPDCAVGDRRIVPLPYRAASRMPGRVPPWARAHAARRANRRMAATLLRLGTDVVLAEYGTLAVDWLEACRMAEVPLVVHFHGYDIYRRDVLVRLRAEYGALFRQAAAMIVGSRDMLAHVEELAGSGERLFFNPCGVDPSVFAPADPAGSPPHFVGVGRFVDKKAPHLTVLAFAEVLRACPEATLTLAGEGPLLECCRQLSRSLRIEGSVRLPGGLDHAAVAGLLRSGRAFVQHSVTAGSGDSEGTAITPLEAGATGLPVVSTRHGGLKDTIVHGETGFLVDEYDVAGMAEHMLVLAREPERAAAMGRCGRERVAGHFSMDAAIGGLYRILEEATGKRRAVTGCE